MALSIAPIGSCRIVDPLRRARETFGFEMNRKRSLGFTHSSPEAVQQLRFMRGEINIPDALWPCVSNVDPVEARAEDHEASDVYIVELSSEKVLSVGETYLQLNYLRGQFESFFANSTRKNGFWRAIERESQEGIDAFLKDCWAGSSAKNADCEVLRQIRLRRADEDQTRQDIRYLRDNLKHVLFVTHVNAIEKTGDVIKSRDRYVRMVTEIAQDEGCAVFDPTPSMWKFGQEQALEPDLNHYTDPFNDRLVEEWFDFYLTGAIEKIVRAAPEQTVDMVLKPYVLARILNGSGPHADRMRAWLARLANDVPRIKEFQSTVAAFS